MGDTQPQQRKKLKALNLEVLLQELKVKSQVEKLVTILDIYSRERTLAGTRTYFEFINEDDFPEGFFDSRPTVSTIITVANASGITLKWKGKFGDQVFLTGCYFKEQFV